MSSTLRGEGGFYLKILAKAAGKNPKKYLGFNKFSVLFIDISCEDNDSTLSVLISILSISSSSPSPLESSAYKSKDSTSKANT